jgi:hypothetical protein
VVVLTGFGQSATLPEEAVMAYFVYENWVRDKAIVHQAACVFCNEGHGLWGSRNTKSSTWHGPYDTADAALRKAKSCRRTRTEGCEKCSPL